MSRFLSITLSVLLLAAVAHAESVYQQPADFIAASFGGTPPRNKVLWVNDELREAVRSSLHRDLGQLRIRYWQEDTRTAWILDEIGKDLPITTGIVIESGAIESVQVLVFRESRGWEVRYPFFTDQFREARLRDSALDRNIDNISGATLSVNALKRQAQLALFLAEYIQ
jgi:hypothetical protein